MKILADENIPLVGEAFSEFGDVLTVPDSEISKNTICDVDLLLVRSVTPVSAQLLAGSRVKFVGTATIGFDHVDLGYLQQEEIGFASAPGSNANSVAEYVLSALCVLADRGGLSLFDKTVAIIGCGHVGSNLLGKLQALGLNCLVNDPPLEERTGEAKFVDLNEVFAADIVTVHVPLEQRGKHPTFKIVNESFLRKMKPGSVLINTSRGAVVDESALERALTKGQIEAVLDVWEGEPDFNTALLARTSLASAHIAGYSYDGKVQGTKMIYEAACRHFDVEPTWRASSAEPSPANILSLPGSLSEEQIVQQAIWASYDIRKDDLDLRRTLGIQPSERPQYFRALRKNYPIRREFHRTEIRLSENLRHLARKLSDLGFKVS